MFNSLDQRTIQTLLKEEETELFLLVTLTLIARSGKLKTSSPKLVTLRALQCPEIQMAEAEVLLSSNSKTKILLKELLTNQVKFSWEDQLRLAKCKSQREEKEDKTTEAIAMQITHQCDGCTPNYYNNCGYI